MRAPSNLWPSTSISVSSKNTSASPAWSHRPGLACWLAQSTNSALRRCRSITLSLVWARSHSPRSESEKPLRLPGVEPPSRLGLLAGPVHQLRVEAVQVHHALFGLGPQPFAQRGLIRAFSQAEQVQEHAVLP